MKTCPKCYRHDNTDEAIQCVQCGHAFDMTADKYARVCPSGRHQMDPSWSSCAFCKAEEVSISYRASGSGTVDELSGVQIDPYLVPPPPPMPGGDRSRGTQIDPILPNLHQQNSNSSAGRPGGGEKGTMFGVATPGIPPAAGEKRRIVGVLITYTWKPEGQVFEVREGRNRIGKDPSCDIVVEQDQSLSAENSSIRFGTKFVIHDLDSMNGTHVNGVEVEEPAYPLPNYASIRAGSTTFTFIAVEGS